MRDLIHNVNHKALLFWGQRGKAEAQLSVQPPTSSPHHVNTNTNSYANTDTSTNTITNTKTHTNINTTIPNSQGQRGKAEVQLSVWPFLSHGESINSSPPKIVPSQYFPTKIETRASAKLQYLDTLDLKWCSTVTNIKKLWEKWEYSNLQNGDSVVPAIWIIVFILCFSENGNCWDVQERPLPERLVAAVLGQFCVTGNYAGTQRHQTIAAEENCISNSSTITIFFSALPLPPKDKR